jgi:hypothetical protein
MYGEDAPVTLSGQVTALDFSSTEGYWDLGKV